MPPKFSGKGRQGLQRCWHTFYQCLYLIGLCCLLLSHECPQISTDRRSQTLLPDLQVLIYSIFSRLMSYTIDSSFLFLSIYKALPMISWLCCYKCSPIQDLLHSISSTLLSFTLTLLFSFLIIVLSYLSWWCWYIFSYLQDLIHSIFSSLLSFSIDFYFFLSIKYTLSSLSWLCCYRFSHFQHTLSIPSFPLLSFTLTLLFSFHLKRLI